MEVPATDITLVLEVMEVRVIQDMDHTIPATEKLITEPLVIVGIRMDPFIETIALGSIR